jgi:hypothetical protein
MSKEHRDYYMAGIADYRERMLFFFRSVLRDHNDALAEVIEILVDELEEEKRKERRQNATVKREENPLHLVSDGGEMHKPQRAKVRRNKLRVLKPKS